MAAQGESGDKETQTRRLDAAFLGPMAENAALLEELVVDAIRDHAYWRRNFHPEDAPRIAAGAPLDPDYQQFVARTRQVLHRLAADLKRSVPWFSPRYIGHMASDLLLPGVVARVLTTLYNPNNVSEDASGVLVRLELEVGDQLAAMVGYPVEDGGAVRAWGHLTSGGTVANIESLWNMRAARMVPLALARAAKELGLRLPAPWDEVDVDSEDGVWRMANLTISAALDFRRATFEGAHRDRGPAGVRALHEACEAWRVETIGMAAFTRAFGLEDPVVVAPHSAHYSWKRAVKLLGLGANALIPVETDVHMRMSAAALRGVLDELEQRRRPVLAVIGVLGTTEFGTLDPIDALVDERDRRGDGRLGFGVHVDAAWGGYLASLFREADGSTAARATLRSSFKYFPSEPVHAAFSALGRTDSITIDPHKLGFIPFPAGAFIARDREIAGLLVETAPYVFDDSAEGATATVDLAQLGKYIVEGSKPGSSAASVHATHAVLPLNRQGFGELIGRTVRATETLYDALHELARSLSDVARLTVPFEPDSNILCLAVNPVGNRDVEEMNAYMRALFETIRFRPNSPLQTHDFIGSFTSVSRDRFSDGQVEEVLGALGLDVSTFAGEGAHLFLLRHTLMNPWLLVGEPPPLMEYVGFLEREVRRLCFERSEAGPRGSGGAPR
jgi:glutamate/tyrosine decarboxylase-like PLP-dependent enzyme